MVILIVELVEFPCLYAVYCSIVIILQSASSGILLSDHEL
jgi:hypothetical protein